MSKVPTLTYNGGTDLLCLLNRTIRHRLEYKMNSNSVRLNYLVEEEFEDTTGIIRRRKSKKDRTCNDE
jgi:hypothetical protein